VVNKKGGEKREQRPETSAVRKVNGRFGGNFPLVERGYQKRKVLINCHGGTKDLREKNRKKKD